MKWKFADFLKLSTVHAPGSFVYSPILLFFCRNFPKTHHSSGNIRLPGANKSLEKHTIRNSSSTELVVILK